MEDSETADRAYPCVEHTVQLGGRETTGHLLPRTYLLPPTYPQYMTFVALPTWMWYLLLAWHLVIRIPASWKTSSPNSLRTLLVNPT